MTTNDPSRVDGECSTDGQDLPQSSNEVASASVENVENERFHELKTWPDYYRYLVDGTKTFEYRRDDRGFRVGDVLWLREWDPTSGYYTGREMMRRVTYILPASTTFVILALAPRGEFAGELYDGESRSLLPSS